MGRAGPGPEPAERLEQRAAPRTRGDHRAGVLHDQLGPAPGRAGPDAHAMPAARHVVRDGVLDEVLHQRSSRTGSPIVGAAAQAASPTLPRRLHVPDVSAMSARSTGTRSVSSARMRASVSRPSMSRSCRALTASSVSPSVPQLRRRRGAVERHLDQRPVDASAACAARARRWRRTGAARRTTGRAAPASTSKVSASSLISSCGPLQRDPLVQAPSAAPAIRRAVSVIRCSGREHPPGDQPADADRGRPPTDRARSSPGSSSDVERCRAGRSACPRPAAGCIWPSRRRAERRTPGGTSRRDLRAGDRAWLRRSAGRPARR